MIGGTGNDTLDGGDGIDTVDYSGSTSGVYVNLSAETRTLGTETVAAGTALDGLGGTDSLLAIENIIGSAYNDYIYGSLYGNTLVGGDGNDRLEGYDAPDILWGGSGADNLIGGNGADTITYADSPGSVYVNMRGTTNFVYDRDVAGLKAIDGFGFTDTLNGIQNVSGSLTTNTHVYASTEGNIITTFAGNDWVFGDAGNDQISTGSGNDILIGGAGNDVMTGGTGADTFVYNFGDGTDTVSDFNVIEDIIRLVDTGSSFTTLDYFDTASGVELSYDGQKYMLLAGVFESNLSEANFQFV